MNVSVCLASCNGAKFIKMQLESIVKQLNDDCEIIIVDDCSSDNTIEVIKSMNDKRIKFFFNEVNKGHVFSFGRAISLATKDIIFMSDQDDIWIEGRVKSMINALTSSNTLVVSSNSEFIDTVGEKINFQLPRLKMVDSTKYFKNIINIFQGKPNYYGCAMAFDRKIVPLILPIPAFVESHDLWIAMASNLMGSNVHLEANTLQRRIHGNNASVLSRKILPKLWSRIIFMLSIVFLYFRMLKFK